MNDITVVIPSIPPREVMLARALLSVQSQTLAPQTTVIVLDIGKEGAPANRQAGLNQVTTEYVAFLDDDDELYPEHLEALRTNIGDADLIYPWFDVGGGTDPFPHHEGKPWDCSNPHQVPITFLARTESVQSAGGFLEDWSETGAVDDEGNRIGEDFLLITRLCARGAKIVHLNQRTWRWHHHASNTSGLPSRW